MLEFRRTTNGFNYIFERELKPYETIIVKMPPISANKRGINDIGWQSDGEVTLCGTLSSRPDKLSPDSELWQQIIDGHEINKTVNALKVKNGQKPCTIIIRAILN